MSCPYPPGSWVTEGAECGQVIKQEEIGATIWLHVQYPSGLVPVPCDLVTACDPTLFAALAATGSRCGATLANGHSCRRRVAIAGTRCYLHKN
jgi:hypothetical protein